MRTVMYKETIITVIDSGNEFRQRILDSANRKTFRERKNMNRTNSGLKQGKPGNRKR